MVVKGATDVLVPYRPHTISNHPGGLTHLPWKKNSRHFTDNIFRYILVNEKLCILIFLIFFVISIFWTKFFSIILTTVTSSGWRGDMVFYEFTVSLLLSCFGKSLSWTTIYWQLTIFFMLKHPVCSYWSIIIIIVEDIQSKNGNYVSKWMAGFSTF